MGFALAKLITGSAHELFVGTEHVRRGEFSHRIRVRTRDQLGQLGESFNAMTSSVKDAFPAGCGEEAALGGVAHRPRHSEIAAAS